MVRYWRLHLFQRAVKRLQPVVRGNRMAEFERIFHLGSGTRIIDLGGTPNIWNLVKTPLNITLLNLPGTRRPNHVQNHHRFTFVEGDATEVRYPDKSFEIVFSNSVIEHVGDESMQRKFAREARRLAPSYYIQTPSRLFPLEAHTGIPFWWALPPTIRAKFHRRWQKTLPDWNEMVLATTVIRRRQLQSYFPDGKLKVEYLYLIPKSYYVFRLRRR